MANRMQKINSHKEVAWRHVPTADNPADLACRGGHIQEANLWWHGPRWLASPELWPADVLRWLNTVSERAFADARISKNQLAVKSYYFIYSTPALSVLFCSIIERSVLMALVFYYKDMLEKVTMERTQQFSAFVC